MEISKEDLEYFSAAVSQVLGVDISTLKQAVTFIQGQQVQASLAPMREAWGDKFDENFNAVQEYFDTLSDDKKAFYDNAEGLQYLFDKHVAPKLAETTQPNASDNVPAIATGQTTGAALTSGNEGLTREKIQAMSKADYAANADAITQFYSTEFAPAT